MKVLIAIDSFKGSISSIKGSEAISQGILSVFPDANITSLPLADGGEGTVDALIEASGGTRITKEVQGPLHKKVNATYGISSDGKTAFIEVAAACGLPLLSKNGLDPLKATTYGVGELILDALKNGCRHFIIGLGGSATNDAGVGMLQALGFQFLDDQGKEVKFGGESLSQIHAINVEQANPLLKECQIQVACDVNNFLHGENGAAYIFGPQKGATSEDIILLDNGLRNFSERVESQLGIGIHRIEGAGAAGGLGAAFAGFLNANLKSGIELILDFLEMEKHMRDADFVITGEGMLDVQTAMGKAPIGVAKMAKRIGIPVIGLAGAIGTENYNLQEKGLTSSFSILNTPMTLENAMDTTRTFENLKFTTTQIFQLIKAIK
ncbi:glycerate kinase [Oceanobacillus sp. CAU 1775]